MFTDVTGQNEFDAHETDTIKGQLFVLVDFLRDAQIHVDLSGCYRCRLQCCPCCSSWENRSFFGCRYYACVDYSASSVHRILLSRLHFLSGMFGPDNARYPQLSTDYGRVRGYTTFICDYCAGDAHEGHIVRIRHSRNQDIAFLHHFGGIFGGHDDSSDSSAYCSLARCNTFYHYFGRLQRCWRRFCFGSFNR